MKNNAVICDIDGVVLTCPYWKDIEDFYQNVDSCTPVDWAVYFINSLHKQGFKIIFITARNCKIKGITLRQLKECFDFNFDLYMRGRYDERIDWVQKEECLNLIEQDYNVVLAIDDNEGNCNMYRKHGITTLRVYGN